MKSEKIIWTTKLLNPNDERRMFCFPYAGGGTAVYRQWESQLPSGIGVYPIMLPGRERRSGESQYESMEELGNAVVQWIVPYLDKPFYLFGHSMGARLAHYVALELLKYSIFPKIVFVSGSLAPHIPEIKPMYNLPDEEIIAELRRLNGTPEEVLCNEELMNILLPMIRADYQIADTYFCGSCLPLNSPIVAFGGTLDLETPMSVLQEWSFYTNRDFRAKLLDGDHFFIHTNENELLHLIEFHISSF